MKLCPEMDISMKREIKVFLKQTIYSGRLCKEPEVLGREKLCSLEIFPVAGEGEGSKERGTGTCTCRSLQQWTERDIQGAGAIQKDPVCAQQGF